MCPRFQRQDNGVQLLQNRSEAHSIFSANEEPGAPSWSSSSWRRSDGYERRVFCFATIRKETQDQTGLSWFVIFYFADSYLFFKYYYLICLWFLHQADRTYPRGTPKHSTAVPGGGQDALHPSMAITPRVWYQILHCQVRWKDWYNRRSMLFMNDNPRGFPFAYFSIIQIQRE